MKAEPPVGLVGGDVIGQYPITLYSKRSRMRKFVMLCGSKQIQDTWMAGIASAVTAFNDPSTLSFASPNLRSGPALSSIGTIRWVLTPTSLHGYHALAMIQLIAVDLCTISGVVYYPGTLSVIVHMSSMPDVAMTTARPGDDTIYLFFQTESQACAFSRILLIASKVCACDLSFITRIMVRYLSMTSL